MPKNRNKIWHQWLHGRNFCKVFVRHDSLGLITIFSLARCTCIIYLYIRPAVCIVTANHKLGMGNGTILTSIRHRYSIDSIRYWPILWYRQRSNQCTCDQIFFDKQKHKGTKLKKYRYLNFGFMNLINLLIFWSNHSAVLLRVYHFRFLFTCVAECLRAFRVEFRLKSMHPWASEV